MKKKADTTEQSSLCLSCGMCCDGTLFATAHLLEPYNDLVPIQKAGVEILKNEKGRYFELNCSLYQNDCCQIYEERPSICRKFKCKLLKKFERGDVTWSDAREKIVRVKKLRESLKEEILKTLPECKDMSVSSLLKIVPDHKLLVADCDLLKKWKNILMILSLLTELFEKEFYSPQKKTQKPNTLG